MKKNHTNLRLKGHVISISDHEKRIKIILNENEFLTCYLDRPTINDLYIVLKNTKSIKKHEHIGYIRWDTNVEAVISYNPLHFKTQSIDLNLNLRIEKVNEDAVEILYREYERLKGLYQIQKNFNYRCMVCNKTKNDQGAWRLYKRVVSKVCRKCAPQYRKPKGR